MKFARLFTTSTILLWQHSVSAQEEHRNVRAGTTVSTGAAVGMTKSAMTKSVAATAIKCKGLKLEDLNFAEFGSNLTCEKNAIVDLVIDTMKDSGCRTKGNDVKNTVMALANIKNYNKARSELVLKCREQSNYEPCTSIEELNFGSLSSCTSGTVLNSLKCNMDRTDCAHDWRYEAKLLTGEETDNAARNSLITTCKTERGCTTDFKVNGCDYIAVKKELARKTKNNCPHDADKELQIITGATSLDEARSILADKCGTALGEVEESTYTDVDDQFTANFMKEYIAGKGFLNERTGNFQGDVEGSDQESIDAGESINDFRKEGAEKTKLVDGDWGDNTFDSCENQAYLCCFGRDRQFGDNNGNCKENDCEDADPGDNSNLCYTEPDLTAYPGEIEDDIHCHGLAWADDDTDLISNFKVNNFFFVSMFDHMYSRGYVGSTVPEDPNKVPMCGCIEHMPKVSRADCTQVDVKLEVKFSRGVDGVLTLQSKAEPQVAFKECRGIQVGTEKKKANNDLASYANKLNKEGRMDDQFMNAIFDTLLGYQSPGNNENEDVCVEGYNGVADAGAGDSDHPCINLDSDDTFQDCDVDSVIQFIKDEMDDDCPHDYKKELQILTGKSTDTEATQYISEMCVSTWDNVWSSYADKSFENIHDDFNDDFMKEYIKGETYLNTRTGNFQGEQLKDSDPQSVAAGGAINKFHKGGAKSSILSANFASEKTDFEDCQLNSIMCCFGRDRQFGDKNGNCKKNDCEDADPGDNSNLCYTEPSFVPFPKKTEGDIHCHGLAWADDTNHPSNVLKYNNFFYVSLYDHMYTRGYVQTMTYDQDELDDVVPMCGCIEDMWPVSRSDCTEIGYDLEFKLIIGAKGIVEASPVDLDDTEIEFNACKGINPKNGNKKNNDLGSYVNRLTKEGKISEDKKESIYEVLVGYMNPNSNSNEKACKVSYEDETQETYPKK